MLPRSGGSKVYLEYTYRRPRFLASTIVAIFAVVFGITASNCIIFAKYVLFALQIEPTDFMTKLLAVGLMTVITIIHSCFLRTGIMIQNVLGWIKVALITFTCLTGIYVLLTRSEEVKLTTGHSNFEDLWADTNWDFNTISTAFFKVLYSYAGLGNINNVLNEVKNPRSNPQDCRTPIALLTACVLYLAINLAFVSVIPLDEVKRSNELIAALFFEKLGYGRWYLPLLIALSAAGNVMVVTFSLVSPISTPLLPHSNPQTDTKTL